MSYRANVLLRATRGSKGNLRTTMNPFNSLLYRALVVSREVEKESIQKTISSQTVGAKGNKVSPMSRKLVLIGTNTWSQLNQRTPEKNPWKMLQLTSDSEWNVKGEHTVRQPGFSSGIL